MTFMTLGQAEDRTFLERSGVTWRSSSFATLPHSSGGTLDKVYSEGRVDD